MITRRKLLLALGAGLAGAPFASAAQLRQTVHRIGILEVGNHVDAANSRRIFTRVLAELGYVDGANVALELRFARGEIGRLPNLARELVDRRVNLIFAATNEAARAAQSATSDTPIVFAFVSDPVGRGLVASFAQPGGNLTGVTSSVPGLMMRRLQLLKQASPELAQVAVAIAREPGAAGPVAAEIGAAQRAASSAGINLLPIEIRSRRSFEDAGEVLTRFRANGMSCLDNAVNTFNRGMLTEFAGEMKLPAIFPSSNYAAAGGLMSYGVNVAATYRQAAAYVGKILKGAKPGDLPVEAPAKLELAVNQDTAKALGLQLPASFLESADRVFG